MRKLVVIGLPKPLRGRLEAAARNKFDVTSVLIEMGKLGRPVLIPHPWRAKEEIDAVTQETADVDILLLPYVPVPPQVRDTIDAAAEIGAHVSTPTVTDGWPHITHGLSGPFLEALFLRLRDHLNLIVRIAPVDMFNEATARTKQLIVAPNALDSLSEIAQGRHRFISDSVSALENAAIANGTVGDLERYFASKGLHLATSGGMLVTVEVVDLSGKRLLKRDTQWHLKQGDKTTPQAAVRIYFDFVDIEGSFAVVVLYAGPHRDGVISRRIPWPL